MPTLFRVEAVLTADGTVEPADVERLRDDLALPEPALADGQDDPGAREVTVAADGRGAELVTVVEAEDDDAARRLVEDAVTAALGRAGGTAGLRLEQLRSSGAYDL